MKNTLFLVVSLSVWSCASLAFAQPAAPSDIEAQHQQGNELRRQHRDEEARVIFQRLWEQTHEPRALARLALAEESLGHNPDSEAHLVQALGHESDPWIQQNRSVLEGTLQQARAAQGVAMLLVASSTPHAEVFLNGARVGAAGTAIRTSPGSVSFEVRAAGFAPESRAATLTPGGTTRIEVNLSASNGATPALGLRGPGAPTPLPTTPSGGGLTRTLAWASAAGAVAFVGVGVVGTVVGGSAADRWNSNECLGSSGTGTDSCSSDRSTAQSMDALRWTGFVAGGALAVTSVALFVMSPGRSERAQASFGCGVGPGTLGLSCGGRF